MHIIIRLDPVHLDNLQCLLLKRVKTVNVYNINTQLEHHIWEAPTKKYVAINDFNDEIKCYLTIFCS